MKVILALALLGCIGAAAARPHFEDFTSKYNKMYASYGHESAARATFEANWDKIDAMNAAHVAAGGEEVFGMSPFLDMTTQDFADFYLGAKVPETLGDLPVFEKSLRADVPNSIDWSAKGATTPIKNQEQCGSCWAFSTTESIESANFIAGNPLKTLTVEQIVDCDTTDSGCQGGNPTTAFQYVIGAGGLESESDYPYTAGGGQTGQCQFDKSKIVQSIRGWSYATQSQDETAMKDAMASKGPLSVCVDAQSWQFYSGGIMKAAGCGTQLDHAVQAVGYDMSSNYWKVRNSWGASWGENG
eukprot:CAMPEP_0203808086 /NCGR_PEP_ID=MMETSP0115-20131106/1419_1 /ASSEMBLY_ACC=CAM_ASM_000227 /TAXON_ID=33651 /ORGANISM="Bicosoecid sp, Strain ms1" /LENGTH=299 /DNA_ID=CAMNT_0050716771 /DNA_START=40 /DNA_END=939 /DNA_ORIENTATION=+